MDCYISSTGSFLPGEPVDNDGIQEFLGRLDGESEVRDKILRMNGIKTRHYALDREGNATHDVYELAALAAEDCIGDGGGSPVGYLSAGSTNTPLVGPGISSILHSRLADKGQLGHPLEINSNSGICTSSAQALVNAFRAVRSGEHASALCVGVEQPSDILKAGAIRPPSDWDGSGDIRRSKWFMSVFLRFMLSDGAGAFLLQNRPGEGVSFRMNWAHSRSFANEAPLCMKLENRSLLLSQDVEVLGQYMKPCIEKTLEGAMENNADRLGSYKVVLPHLSSFIFKRYLLQVLRAFARDGGREVGYWTNLEWAGNTGAASIYIMLDEYARSHDLQDGEKILLFIPESGQFNFVFVSLTVVR